MACKKRKTIYTFLIKKNSIQTIIQSKSTIIGLTDSDVNRIKPIVCMNCSIHNNAFTIINSQFWQTNVYLHKIFRVQIRTNYRHFVCFLCAVAVAYLLISWAGHHTRKYNSVSFASVYKLNACNFREKIPKRFFHVFTVSFYFILFIKTNIDKTQLSYFILWN